MNIALTLNETEQSDIQNLNFGVLNTFSVVENELDQEKYEETLKKYTSDYLQNPNDFSTYKFRPHAIHKIMGGVPKPLTDRQAETLTAYQNKLNTEKLTEKQSIDYGSLLAKKNAKMTLSTGAITYLNELHKEIVFNRTNEVRSKYLDKGLAVEHLSIDIINEVYNLNLEKNNTRFENDYLSGEPDIIHENEVYDIKSSWDFRTFPIHEKEIETKAYYYQLQGYMDLLGFNHSKLIYVLVDTPETLIEDELYRVSKELGTFSEGLKFDLPAELELEIRRNLVYEDIPKETRIKIFDVERNDKVINDIHQMIGLARTYLVEIDNKLKNKIYEFN